MKLIDSSSWIHALRKEGDPIIRERVRELLINNEAAWCDIVRVELWRGVSKKKELNFLKELEENIHLLPLTAETWSIACNMGQKCRINGTPVPTTDLIIAACARSHDLELEHSDKHFDLLGKIA